MNFVPLVPDRTEQETDQHSPVQVPGGFAPENAVAEVRLKSNPWTFISAARPPICPDAGYFFHSAMIEAAVRVAYGVKAPSLIRWAEVVDGQQCTAVKHAGTAADDIGNAKHRREENLSVDCRRMTQEIRRICVGTTSRWNSRVPAELGDTNNRSGILQSDMSFKPSSI